MAALPVYQPMLAIRWEAPFSDADWAFEVKWDGVRAIASWDGRRFDLRSRTGRSIAPEYPELDVVDSPQPCAVDGEIVAFDAAGRPSFGLLQQRATLRRAGTEPEIRFMAFDLLHADGPLLDLPWHERRRRLEELELPGPFVVPEPVLGDGEALWAGVVEQRLEGMVAKRLESVYRPGARSPDWRKVARIEQARAVVGGFLPGEGGRANTFGSLLLGHVDGDALRYVGAVGTGFRSADLLAIHRALGEMSTTTSPFGAGSDLPAGAVFVEPGLVALVAFKEWTRLGKLRAPSFKGFTDDAWQEVTWAAEGPPAR